MSKVVKDKFKHLIIYLISFAINYLIFIFLMLFVNENSAVGINVVNLIAWIVSMIKSMFLIWLMKIIVANYLNLFL